MGLLHLPNELLLMVAQDLSLGDLNSLIRTHPLLTAVLSSQTYKHAANSEKHLLLALTWSAMYAQRQLLRTILASRHFSILMNGCLIPSPPINPSLSPPPSSQSQPQSPSPPPPPGDQFPCPRPDRERERELEHELLYLLPNPPLLQNPRTGHTPLHLSIKHQSTRLLHQLLSHPLGKSHVDVPAWDGRTPLHMAVSTGNRDLVCMLVGAGANIDCKQRGRQALTPLHMALERRDKGMFGLLRELGADENVPDVFGFTVEWHLRLGCEERERRRNRERGWW
ncbi:ankyrin repeat-containing domain protein [Tuber indicum]|nr:ankyrin repeat-containing domain protein [Tuber indicum]